MVNYVSPPFVAGTPLFISPSAAANPTFPYVMPSVTGSMINKSQILTSAQTRGWGHQFLQAAEVYDKTQGEKACVFVLDTSGKFDHPDLRQNAWHQFAKNFTNSSNDVDVHGHGTHVAGIVAASNNDIGVVGIAPKAHIVPIKIFNDSGRLQVPWLVSAIKYVADLDLGDASIKKIITMSLGLGPGQRPDPEVAEAITYAISKNVFVVKSAGNSRYSGSGSSITDPGTHPDIMAIASLKEGGQRSSFSSGGPELFMAAPGEKIFSTYRNGDYAFLSGTSMAAPAIAGAIALLVTAKPSIENQAQLKKLFLEHVLDLRAPGFDNWTGNGTPVLTNYFV
ncbi:hypothetical protein BVY03_01660 [bacterium K02(2017)]|nr:hypothetical protein BVY03_01660 [bacterium K02(2017)]